MGFPHELLPFAENFYRRFPEEFVALGMPGLEQVYDLRTDGTRSRTFCETQTEKTIAITIHRWQAPHLPPPVAAPPPMQHPYGHAASYGHAAPYGQAPSYGAWQMPAYPYPYAADNSQPMRPYEPAWNNACHPQGTPIGTSPPAQQNAAAHQHLVKDNRAVEAQIARLESTIALLMPQIEAAAISRQEVQANLANQPRPRPPGTPGSAADNVDGLLSPSPISPLRNRRDVKQLQITPPVKEKSGEEVQPQIVQPQREPAPIITNVRREAPPRILATRMVPNAGDPESPRSPGKFSVWK